MATIFSSAQLNQLVTDTIPTALPDGHTNAIVAAVDQNGVKVVAGFAKDQGKGTWQLQGAYAHDWTGDNKLGARVVFSW